jgi:hypothetical protein
MLIVRQNTVLDERSFWWSLSAKCCSVQSRPLLCSHIFINICLLQGALSSESRRNSPQGSREIPHLLRNPRVTCSRGPVRGPSPGPDESGPHALTLSLRCILILYSPSTPISARWSIQVPQLSFCTHFLYFQCVLYAFAISFCLLIQVIFEDAYNLWSSLLITHLSSFVRCFFPLRPVDCSQ